MNLRPLLPLATAALLLPRIAYAGANLVTDGSFSAYTDNAGTSNFELGSPTAANYGSLTNWTVGNASTTGSNGAYINVFGVNGASPATSAGAATTQSQYASGTQYLSPSYTGVSPDGGSFLAFSADAATAGTLSQTISSLTVGSIYNLAFYWAATEYQGAHAATSEQFQVTFGGSTQSTAVVNIAANGFSGWMRQTLNFTATSTSQTLTFLATGGPSGQPPLALLDGVSLTLPEPGTLPITMVGLAGIAAFGGWRRRPSRRTAAQVRA